MTECALGKLSIFKIYFLIWKIRLIMALLHWVIVGVGTRWDNASKVPSTRRKR